MNFGSVDVLPVYGFLKTYIMMVTNMKDYLTLDEKDDNADFRYDYRDTMIAQFKQDLCNKYFSLEDQDKRDDYLQNESFFGLIMMLKWEDLYQKTFMIMIITVLE